MKPPMLKAHRSRVTALPSAEPEEPDEPEPLVAAAGGQTEGHARGQQECKRSFHVHIGSSFIFHKIDVCDSITVVWIV